MIGHSNETTDLELPRRRSSTTGSYLGWDRCGLPLAVPLDTQIDTLAALCARGYAGRMMLSHDKSSFMDWFRDAEVDAVLPDWRYTYIHDAVLPGLRDRGVTDEQIEQMLVRNPRAVLRAGQRAGLMRCSSPRLTPGGANPFDDSGVAAGRRRRPPLSGPARVAGRDAQTRACEPIRRPRRWSRWAVSGSATPQLWDRAARVSGGLREAGISPGDRVAIRLPNSIDWVLAFFGGLMAGAVVVPVNTRFTEPKPRT